MRSKGRAGQQGEALNVLAEERIVEFERLLAAALRRILAESAAPPIESNGNATPDSRASARGGEP